MSITPEMENRLRQGFKALNRWMLLLWRLGLGNWLNAWPKVRPKNRHCAENAHPFCSSQWGNILCRRVRAGFQWVPKYAGEPTRRGVRVDGGKGQNLIHLNSG